MATLRRVRLDAGRAAIDGFVSHPRRDAVLLLRVAVLACVVTGCGGAVVVMRRSSFAASLTDLPWSVAALASALPILTVAHYACAALALRAASGRPLPLADTTRAQLSAAVVNRLVPNDLAGNAVNVRYLQPCGSEGGAAVSTLVALSLIGSLADTAYAVGVDALGPFAGVEGASGELQRLTRHGTSAGNRSPWLCLTLAGVVLAALVRRYGVPSRAALVRGVRQGARHATGLAAARRRVLVAAAAKGGGHANHVVIRCRRGHGLFTRCSCRRGQDR